MSLQHTEAEKIDRFWTFPSSLVCMPLGKAAEFDEFGLARFERKAELPQPLVQDVLDPTSVRPVLKAYHEVIDVPQQVGFTS